MPDEQKPMTDAELDRITDLAISGELDEEVYKRLVEAAIANGEAILANPERLAKVCKQPFVAAPKRPRGKIVTDDERSYGPAGPPPGRKKNRS